MDVPEPPTPAKACTCNCGKMGQGYVMHAQAREIVAKVIDFMKNEAENFRRFNQPTIPLTHFRERILTATGISNKMYSTICKEAEAIATGASTSFTTPANNKKGKRKKCEPPEEEKHAILNEFCIAEIIPNVDDK